MTNFREIDRIEQLWSGVDRCEPDECWPWNRYRHPDGYGMLGVRGVNTYAHRQMWTLIFGPIPPGMIVCHLCDNPPCCNPSHLFIGTTIDNVRDCVAKGRKRTVPSPGERNTFAKLSSAQVEAIRAAYNRGAIRQVDIANEFGVTQTQISKIVTGRCWSHLETVHAVDANHNKVPS